MNLTHLNTEVLPSISLTDFDYKLPEERIAFYPLEKRDESKLLHFENGTIKTYVFKQLPSLLPAHTQLVFNNTKVIPARIWFQNENGGIVEVFLLEPANGKEIGLVMYEKGPQIFKCLIGGKKKWKPDTLLKIEVNGSVILRAKLIDKEENLVELIPTDNNATTAEILQVVGHIPLPPYLNRAEEESDAIQYQTVYAKQEGAVAAPTAGLHFTNEVLNALSEQNFTLLELTLHTGAGTFMPVKTENVLDHQMHNEQVVIEYELIKQLALGKGKVVAVGTTSVRTLESLYWFGMKLLTQNEASEFFVGKLEPYQYTASELRPYKEVFEKVLAFMDAKGVKQLKGGTELMITPFYKYQVISGLITNFHQPKSTLLMLISSVVGDAWKDIYEYALANDYRFLSYGDSSLLWVKKD